jgi:hypothetical protein
MTVHLFRMDGEEGLVLRFKVFWSVLDAGEASIVCEHVYQCIGMHSTVGSKVPIGSAVSGCDESVVNKQQGRRS